MERKEMSRERTPKGGLYATQISISFNYWFWSAKQRGEEEMSSERETPKGVTQITQNPYLSQLLPSILPIDRLDGWVVRQSGCVCNLDIQISVNYLVIGSEGKVKWAMEKKPKWYARHSNIQSPVNSCHQFLCSAQQTEGGVLRYPSGCVSI